MSWYTLLCQIGKAYGVNLTFDDRSIHYFIDGLNCDLGL